MKPIQNEEVNIVASIDEVSKLLNIPKSKLRFYDQSGIIHSKRISSESNAFTP